MKPFEALVCRAAFVTTLALVAGGCAAEASEAEDTLRVGGLKLAISDHPAENDGAKGEDRHRHPRPERPLTFATLFKSPLVIEGLTGDGQGQLYTAARGGDPCPVWRIDLDGAPTAVVGNIPAPCSANGLAFDAVGQLYVASTDKIYRLEPSDTSPPTAAVFASGLAGANGLTFDADGNLWVSDGTSAQGRVWKIAPDGSVTVALRVQALASTVNVALGVGGIGRDARALPPGRLNITETNRSAADTAGSQPVVANGLAFTSQGDLLVADTARGAIWRARFDGEGNVTSSLGCDAAFPPDTLCLDELLVAHPLLEGVDGIVLDANDNVWATAHERNAIVRVTPSGKVREVFRNPMDPTSLLRNTGPLEFPTTPFLADGKLCITHSDQGRRDNFPSSGGEVGPGHPELGKISCSSERVVRR